MSDSGPEPMEQDAVASVQSMGLPDKVSEGFPLMEGDTEDVPRSEETHPPAALEEPEDRLEKLLGSFEDKKKSAESLPQEGNNGRHSLKKEILEHLQGNGLRKGSPTSAPAVEEEDDERRSPVKKPAPVKSVRVSLPLPSPKKYPSILSKVSPSQPKKPALQAIINDLRKEIEKENDTSKIDLPVSGIPRHPAAGVKRKFPSENVMERSSPVASSTSLPSVKRPRGYGEKLAAPPPSKLGPKPALLQMKQHRQILSEVMKEMSSSGMHTDTTMIAGGQKISVHRLVLAAASPFLKSVLADQTGDATIIIPETPYEDLAMLIDYVYCGESVVPEDRLSVILHLMSVLGFSPPIYSIRKGKPMPKTTSRPMPRPVGVSPEAQQPVKAYTGVTLAPKPVAAGPRPVPRKIGGPVEEDTLAAAVRQIDDNFSVAPERKVGACLIRQISKQEAQAPRKKAIGRKIEVRPDKPSKTVIKLKEPFDRHKPRKVVIQRIDAEGEKTDDVNAALALTSLGGQPQQSDSQVMGEDLDAYQEANYQEGAYPESMLNSLLNTDQGGAMSMPSLDPDPLPEGKADSLHAQEGAYMLEDGTIIQGGGIEGLPIATEGSDGTTYILVMDENQENLDLNQVIQGLSGGGEGNQAMLRIEEDGTVSYAPTEDQADGGIYAAGDDDSGLAYTGMTEGFDGQHFEGQEYSEGYLEGEQRPEESKSLPPVLGVDVEEGSSQKSDDLPTASPPGIGKSSTGVAKRIFSCKDCSAVFRGMDSLNMHIARAHTGVPAFACTKCDERFHTRPRLNKHLILVHEKGKAFTCDCGARFFRRDNLKDHIRRHEGSRPYSCVTCQRAYASKADLLAHERSHKGERPYHCTLCSKTFNAARSLKLHKIRIHTCEFCDAKFKSAEIRAEHYFLHETEFACLICSKKCGNYATYCEHMLVHNQHVCVLCGIHLGTEEAYKEHVDSHRSLVLSAD